MCFFISNFCHLKQSVDSLCNLTELFIALCIYIDDPHKISDLKNLYVWVMKTSTVKFFLSFFPRFYVMLALNLFLFNPTLVIIACSLLRSLGIIQFLCDLHILQYWKVILEKFQMFLLLALWHKNKKYHQGNGRLQRQFILLSQTKV